MDTLAHAFYGITFCSHSGLAGGRTGPLDAQGRQRRLDWTIWAAAGFGVLPDVASIAWPFFRMLFIEQQFDVADIPPFVFTLYRVTHSLVISLAFSLALRWLWKPLFVPSLAWSVHIFTDILTHQTGVFQQMFLYPFSSLTIPAINWWEHSWVIYTYWAIPCIAWAGLLLARRKRLRWR